METDSATAWPISRLHVKRFQKDVSVNYFRKILIRIFEQAAIMLGWRSQTHVMRSSFPVFIFWVTIQISAACCYGDVLRLTHAQNVRSSRRRFGVFRGTFWTSGSRLISPTAFSADGQPSGLVCQSLKAHLTPKLIEQCNNFLFSETKKKLSVRMW